MYRTSEYTNLKYFYCVDTLVRGGGNSILWEIFMVWKKNGKFADKPKPMSKVWDKNMRMTRLTHTGS